MSDIRLLFWRLCDVFLGRLKELLLASFFVCGLYGMKLVLTHCPIACFNRIAFWVTVFFIFFI